MEIHGIQLFLAYYLCSFAGVHCFNVWLGHKMVNAVCKQVVNYKGGEVPDGNEDAELHAGQKECEWISWSRCSAGTECKLSKKNHCGGGEKQASVVEHQKDNGESEKQSDGMVPFSIPTSLASEIKLPHRLDLSLDHPNAVKGNMTLWHATLGGFDKVESRLKYDPKQLSFSGEIDFESFRLKGNYSWHMIFSDGGNAKTFKGGGRINLEIKNLKLTGGTGQFSYSPKSGTYQLSKFDSDGASSNEWQGELTGSTLDGKAASLNDVFLANGKSGNHFIQELLRQILNFAAPKNLPGRHLDLFFSAFRHDTATSFNKKR